MILLLTLVGLAGFIVGQFGLYGEVSMGSGQKSLVVEVIHTFIFIILVDFNKCSFL